MALRVVEALEVVEIEHQQGEGPSGLDGGAELTLERAVVLESRQRVLVGTGADLAVGLRVLHRDRRLTREELRQLELVGREVRLDTAESPDIERADRVAVDEQRDDHHRFGFERCVRHLDGPIVEMRIVGEHGLAVLQHPARQAIPDRSLVRQDLVGEAVASDDGATRSAVVVGVVHGQ